MILSIIVAESINHVIGKDNQLPWHLPADLKHFKNLTMGHHMIMGRKTYESIGKPLPGRTSIVVTRDLNYKADGCIVVNSIAEGIEAAKKNNDNEAFIIGGAELIKSSECLANKIYLTVINQEFEGDIFLALNYADWKEVEAITHQPDEKNKYEYTFKVLVKK